MKRLISVGIVGGLIASFAFTAGAQDGEYSADAYASCAACHLPDGVGIPGAFPPIRNRAAKIAALLDRGNSDTP